MAAMNYYLYANCHDPIQKISGDAYARHCAIREGTRRAVGNHGPDPELEEIVHKYILQHSAYETGRLTKRNPRSIRDAAIRMGYEFVSECGTYGHWVAPTNMGPRVRRPYGKFTKARLAEVTRYVEENIATMGVTMIANKLNHSRRTILYTLKRAGYEYSGKRWYKR